MKYEKLSLNNYQNILLPFICSFAEEPNNDEWTMEMADKKWRQTLSNPNYEGYIAYDSSNNVIGHIGGVHEVYYLGETFVLEEFFVAKEVKNQGKGTEMLKWFEAHLKENNVVLIRFFTSRHPAQEGFYKKRGYQTWDELIMMSREL